MSACKAEGCVARFANRDGRRVHSILGSVLIALANVATATSPAAGQQTAGFDPTHQLVGFEEAELGPDADLYQLAEISALAGKQLTAEQLAAVQQKWRAERERVAHELERLKSDPLARSHRLLARKLATHPFFSKIELVECTDFAPVLFLIERPPKAAPGFEKAVAQFYGPWASKAVATFEQDFAAILPAARREGRALLPIAVLSSAGEIQNYWRTSSTDDYVGGVGAYERDLPIAVVYRDSFGEKRRDDSQRLYALYGILRAELASYAVSDKAPLAAWVREGLSVLYAENSGTSAQPMVGSLNARSLSSFGKLLRDRDARDTFLQPIDQLTAVSDWSDLVKRASNRTGAVPDDAQNWGYPLHDDFQVESSLFAWQLLHEAGAPHAALVRRPLAACFGTEAKLPPDSGRAPTSAELQKSFMRYAACEIGARKIEEALPDELVTQLETWQPAKTAAPAANSTGSTDAAGATGRTAAAMPAVSKVLDANFRPDMLLDLPLPYDAELGAALITAAAGDVEAARHACESLHEKLGDADRFGARAGREIARLDALNALRHDFFDHCCAEKKKGKFEYDGVTIAGTLEERDGEALLVVDPKNQVQRVPLASIGCDDLLRRMTESKSDLGSPLVRSYAALLAGRKSWKTTLGKTPEEDALREDGENGAALLATGRAAQRIRTLAKTPLPTYAAAGERLLEEIRSTLAEFKKEALVVAREPLLREFAAYALAAQFEAKGLTSLGGHGKVTPLGDGRVSVTWDFDHADQADDWTPTPLGKTLRWKEHLATSDSAAYMKILGGDLVTLGAQYWRTKLEFEAPMEVVVHASVDDPKLGGNWPFSNFGVSLCDNGLDGRVITFQMAGIAVHDGSNYEEDYEPTSYEVDTDYTIRVVHDGKKATIHCAGFKDRTVDVRGHTHGSVGLVAYTDMIVRFHDLTVEGRIAPASIVPVRDAWIERELAKFDAPAPTKH